MLPFADPIDRLLSLDLGGRGIAEFFTPGAAVAAARALLRSRRVLITTGFNVGPDLPETDGPPGAAVLGRALRELGADVSYVTDPITVPVLRAALKIVEEPCDIETYPDGADAAERVLRAHRPTHLVAIERPGRSRSGDYLNARGGSVRAWNAAIDDLFLAPGRASVMRRASSKRRASARGRQDGAQAAGSAATGAALTTNNSGSTMRRAAPRPVTIGIGDGGNEIGMGNVRARLGRQSTLMARIASVVRVDHLIVAGTSNWGAYGVVAALGRLTGRALLHDATLEHSLVEACVEAGAVDGLTRRRETTVDGLPVDVHAAMVTLLGASARPSSRS